MGLERLLARSTCAARVSLVGKQRIVWEFPSIYYFTMATPHPSDGPGGLTTFNIQHGFAEALLRGMRSSFLKDSDYHHLTQCETLDDVRLNLTETDYSEALADSTAMTPNLLQKVAVDKVCFFV